MILNNFFCFLSLVKAGVVKHNDRFLEKLRKQMTLKPDVEKEASVL